MQFGDILVCMDGSENGRQCTSIALRLALHSHARVIGYYLPAAAAGVGFPESSVPSSMDDEAVEFDRQLRLRGLEGTFVAGEKRGNIADIADHARCVDLIVAGLGFPDGPDPDQLNIEQLVLECGRPVLGIPLAGASDEIGMNVMVAWDGSRESARALHDALPFLREASAVTVAAIDEDVSSAASAMNAIAHLKRLGIAAAIDTLPDLGMPIGDELLSKIERNEIDLLVAGAFGHSRLREHLVGGTSRTLLHQMMVPVLVSH